MGGTERLCRRINRRFPGKSKGDTDMGSLSTSELGILAAATGGCALILTVIFGFILLPVLRHFKLGQPIRTEGPIWHQPKAGTPTMGGICFILAFLLATAGYAVFRAVRGEGGRLIPLALAVLFALGNAAIGFIDDYCKLVRHQNEGLTERQKLLLQLVLLPALPLPVLPQVLLRFSESADDAPDSSCLCCSPDCVPLRIFSSLPELLLLF